MYPLDLPVPPTLPNTASTAPYPIFPAFHSPLPINSTPLQFTRRSSDSGFGAEMKEKNTERTIHTDQRGSAQTGKEICQCREGGGKNPPRDQAPRGANLGVQISTAARGPIVTLTGETGQS